MPFICHRSSNVTRIKKEVVDEHLLVCGIPFYGHWHSIYKLKGSERTIIRMYLKDMGPASEMIP